jgi:hypothetical protein
MTSLREEFMERFENWEGPSLSTISTRNVVADFFLSKFREKVAGQKKNIGYNDKEKVKPSTEEEILANNYETNAEAFFAGHDQALDDLLDSLER